MSSKCLFPVLVVALFLSYNISTSVAGFSSGRSGGRMGGSSFDPPPPSSSKLSSPTSSRGLDDAEDSSYSILFSGYYSNEPRRRGSTISPPSSHFHNYHYSPPVSKETTRRFDPSSSTVPEEANENDTETETENENKKSGSYSGFLIFLGTVILAIGGFLHLTEPWYGASVLMVQIGLSGKAKLLLEDLNRIAESADTSGVKGFHHVLQETVSVLLQHRDYWISGFTYVDKKNSVTASEKCFNQHSLEERKKVDIESLVNFNGELKRKSTQKGNKLEKNYIVVVFFPGISIYIISLCAKSSLQTSMDYWCPTSQKVELTESQLIFGASVVLVTSMVTILLAIRGVQNLPPIKTAENLKTSLESLKFVSLVDTMAVEVLWTPQDGKDMLSEDDLLENYHHLRPI